MNTSWTLRALGLAAVLIVVPACHRDRVEKRTTVIAPTAPTISGPVSPLAGGTVGQPYPSTTFTAAGDPPISWSTSGTLPPGMTLNTSTGVYSGTPTTAGTFTFSVTATNSVGADTDAYSHTIAPAPVPPTITGPASPLASGTVGTPYPTTTFNASGSTPITWTTSGTLPPGLTLSTAGVYSGTPTTSGTFTFAVTAANAGGFDTDVYTHTINVPATPPTLTGPASPLPGGTVGAAYPTTTFTATGTTPITWSVTGTLPPGMTLSSGGVYSGTPTTAGTYSFTVSASNAGGTDSDPYSHTISPAAAPPVITGPASPLPAGAVGVPYPSTTFTASGTTPITWSVTGTLPPGMTLSSAGVYSGTPTTAGTFSFTVNATNSVGSDADPYVHAISAVALSLPESEPNDTSGTADAIPIGTPGTGSVAAVGDVDYWSFTAAAGAVVRIEVFALRLDQPAWNTAANNPDVALFATDGITALLTDANFNGGDQEFPFFRILTTGTYFVRVQRQTATLAGGAYSIRITSLPTPSYVELEPVGGATNDTSATAEAVAGTSGTIWGHRAAAAPPDFYSITVAGASILRLRMIAHLNGLQGSSQYDSRVEIYATDGTTLISAYDDAIEFDAYGSYAFTTAGTYFLRVAAFGGLGSGGQYLLEWSLAATTVTETEPNDTSATATAITYGAAVTGALGAADTDYFSFTASAGDQILLEVMDSTGGKMQGALDVVVADLLGSDGVTAVLNDLTTSAGAIGGPLTNVFCRTAILQSSGTHYVRITPDLSPVATPYAFRITLVRNATAEVESNNTSATANAIPATAPRVAGAISVAGDVDYYSFTASAGELVVFRCITEFPASTIAPPLDGHGSNLIGLLTVYGTSGTTVITSANRSLIRRPQGLVVVDIGLEVAFVAPVSGTYFISVADVGGVGGADRYYLLSRE